MNILKNSYVLGFLVVVAEFIINSFLTLANFPHISGIILASIAGWIYSSYHKEKMPRHERFKTLAVYCLLVGIVGVFVVLSGPATATLGLEIALILGLVLLYAVAMYFMLGVGSSQYMSLYEKKQAAANVGQPDIQQDPLTPIPGATEFRNKHPKFALIVSIIVVAALFVGIVFIAADPLYENNIRIYTAVLAGLMALMLVGAMWRVLGKRTWVALISAGVLILVAFSVYGYIAHKPPSSGANQIMVAAEHVALKCVEKGANLRGKLSGWNKGMPDVESPICNQESNWKMLPGGWAYTKIVDADVSDGTFTFGAHSRTGDYIFCGEKWCAARDAIGSTTILYTAPTPVSAAFTIPPSAITRAGTTVEIAQMTLTNSTTKPIDLSALWFKKSGTASDGAIQMVNIEEGENSFGTNYLASLHSSYTSKDGMVYINQPGMFALTPGQSRTYRILIQLSTGAHTDSGKTIGLDLVGFSSDSKVSGVPASGALYTIQ